MKSRESRLNPSLIAGGTDAMEVYQRGITIESQLRRVSRAHT